MKIKLAPNTHTKCVLEQRKTTSIIIEITKNPFLPLDFGAEVTPLSNGCFGALGGLETHMCMFPTEIAASNGNGEGL